MKQKLMLVLAVAFCLVSCQEKEFNQNDPQGSFALAKEPYDDENYEIALTKLGEYKTRFPYSHYAAEAELLIANSNYELDRFAEATAAYQQFIKLHPKHPKRAYAQFRIGECYWADAPTAVNREQDLTAKAISEWQSLLRDYPKSTYAGQARKLIAQGRRRIAEAEGAIAAFYCKQEIWHACAYRYIALAEKSPAEFKDIIKDALEHAADALDKMADTKPRADQPEHNLFTRKLNPKEMRQKAQEFRKKAKTIA